MTTTKTALVTGANKGIGHAVTEQLARAGYTVWLGARDERRGRAAARELGAHGDVRWVALDVTSDESVAAARATVEAATPVLDALVNNAGITLPSDGPPSTIPLASFRDIFAVNVEGPLRVTQALLPLLRRSNSGRIVMVSSGLGSLTWQLDPSMGLVQFPVVGYNASKTALDALIVAFANELASSEIRVTGVNPGYVATDLNHHEGTGTAADGARAVIAALDAAHLHHGRVQDGERLMPW